jgi:hypothetical protein
MSPAASVERRWDGVADKSAQPPVPRLHRSSIPKHEPRPASRVTLRDDAATPPATQGTLALALPSAFESDADDTENAPGSTEAQWQAGALVGLLPEPTAWASTFIQAAMEVAGGLRSAGQLVRWTTPEVHAVLVRRGALTARARRGGANIGSKPRLRALVSCTPRAGVCELSAVIAEPDRVRAVAFRMEGLHGRWRVTELQIG